MNNELKKLIERFEVEIWLYLDGSLSEQEKGFWDSKINKHPQIKTIFNETVQTLDSYKKNADVDISDSAVDEMVNNLEEQTDSKNILTLITGFFDSFFSNQFTGIKIAALSVLSVTALILLLTTEKPNAVKNFSSEIFSWQGNSINDDINQIDNSIETLSMEEWEKYQYIKATHDQWEESFYLLNSEIERMKQDIGDTSL